MRNHNAEELRAIKLRVNRDLLEEIRKLAEHDGRSINSYMNALMRQQVAAFIRQTEGKKK